MSAPIHIAKLSAVALILAAVLEVSGCSTHAAAPEAPRYALVAHPQDAAGASGEVYSGDVHARYESQLGFRVAGKIRARLVDVGSHVEAGQVLAELDPLDLRLQVASAQANLSSAQAARDLAQSEHDRYRALLDKLDVPGDATAAMVGFNLNANKLATATVTGLYAR